MAGSGPESDPYWAPTNFTDWNEYRVGGTVSFSLFFLSIILWVGIGWSLAHKKKAQMINRENQEYEVESTSTDCLFGFLPIGIHTLQLNKINRSELRVTKTRCCGCCCAQDLKIDLSKAEIKVSLRFCNALSIFMAITIGFCFALFSHFIPCIWWTCDMGYYDGEEIRGYIWFIGWPCFTILFMLLGVMCQYVKIDAENPPKRSWSCSKSVWVSIGNNHCLHSSSFKVNERLRLSDSSNKTNASYQGVDM